MERSRTEYSVLNIIAGVGGYILNTIIGFVCRIFFVKCLSADYLGVNGLFANILSMLTLAELGIGSAIVYALYKPLAEHDEDKIASLMKAYARAYQVIGIVVAIVGLCLLPFLDLIITEQPNINESITLLYLLNLFNTASTYFFSYKSSLLIAAQMNYMVSAISYIISIVQSIIQVMFLMSTHNYLMYLLVQTACTFGYNVIVSKFAEKKFPFIRYKNAKPLAKEEKMSLFKNVRDLLMYKISSLLINSTDNILITFFDGLIVTGVTSNYTLLVNTLNSLLSQVFNGLTASIGNHNATESSAKKFKMFSFLRFMNFWIFGWATLGIIFCSADIVELCFGKEYVLSIRIPLVMAINFFLLGMQNSVWTYKHTLGLFRYGRLLQLVTGFLNIIFSVVLGKLWGVFGVLLATIFSRLFTSLWYDPYAVYKHGFHKSPVNYFLEYIKYVCILLIAAFFCNFIFSFVYGGILFKVVLKMILCSLITNVVFYFCLRETNEFKRFEEVLINVIKIVQSKFMKLIKRRKIQ